MSLKKILLKGTTRLSLHERFTYLRSQSSSSEPQTVQVQAVRQGLFSDRPASYKNRHLAHVMDRRPTVMAALRLKNRIMKQRLGQVQRPRPSIKERLNLRGRGRGGLRGRLGQRGVGRSPLRGQLRGRGQRGNGSNGSTSGNFNRRGNLSRSQSTSNLIRSQSSQSLNNWRGGSGGSGRFQNRNSFNQQEFRRGGRGRSFRSRGGTRGGYRGGGIRGGVNKSYRDDFQGRRGGNSGRYNNRGFRSRGFRSRGGGRGRGRGRGGQAPSREELDSQLDQYMSGSRGTLDRELESYMQQQESWD